MFKNWPRGFDRIAILLAIPIAVWGFKYSSEKYEISKEVMITLTKNEDFCLKNKCLSSLDEKPDIFDQILCENFFGFPKQNGIIAQGRKELQKIKEKNIHLKNILDRVIQEGGDPKGTLIEKKEKWVLDDNKDEKVEIKSIYLIPSKFKCYIAGTYGAFGFALITILSIGLITRIIPKTIKWVKEGFKRN